MVEGFGWRRVSGLESFEFRVEQAGVGVMAAEALLVSRRGLRAKTVLLEGTVEGSLGFELLERVGGPAEGVGHDTLRGNCVFSIGDKVFDVCKRISV